MKTDKKDEGFDELKAFFSDQKISLLHEDHVDILFKGYLYHFNKNTGKIEIHDIKP